MKTYADRGDNEMARIRNSFVPNRFGGGYEKTITTDSGSYTLRNTFVPNRFGGGYEQELGPSSDAYAVEKGWTVGTRGSVASSYIAYLLGITEINPLGAHYYCQKCHYVEFHNEYYCGADMEDKICKCGTKLKKDGFTIPPETLFHTDGSFVFSIDLNFPNEYMSQALEDKKAVCAMIDQNCKGEGVKVYKDRKIEHFADHLDMLCHDMPSMLKRLEESTGVVSK